MQGQFSARRRGTTRLLGLPSPKNEAPFRPVEHQPRPPALVVQGQFAGRFPGESGSAWAHRANPFAIGADCRPQGPGLSGPGAVKKSARSIKMSRSTPGPGRVFQGGTHRAGVFVPAIDGAPGAGGKSRTARSFANGPGWPPGGRARFAWAKSRARPGGSFRAIKAASMGDGARAAHGVQKGNLAPETAENKQGRSQVFRAGAPLGRCQAVASFVQMNSAGVQADHRPAVLVAQKNHLPADIARARQAGGGGYAQVFQAQFHPLLHRFGHRGRRGPRPPCFMLTCTARGSGPLSKKASQGTASAWRLMSARTRTLKSARRKQQPARGAQPKVGTVGFAKAPVKKARRRVPPRPRPCPAL